MVNVYALFIISSSLSVFASPAADLTVNQIKASITVLGSQLTNMARDLQNFPNSGGTLKAALGIHKDGVDVEVTLNKCTSEAGDIVGVVSDGDAEALLEGVEALLPSIKSTLVGVVAKKPAFEGLPVGGIPRIVEQDLRGLDGAAVALGVKFASICPAKYESRANRIRVVLHSLFANAIAAYAP